MSGQQIGTVIGGVAGAIFGAGSPAAIQLGMAIGGFVGGVIDPVKITGPQIGDGQQQSATDGSPIAWIQGTSTVAGTIVQVSTRRQIKHKDSGKGGPTQVTYTAEQDFAILVCESCELRDSTMSSVLMVMQDGKIVYDVRPGSTMLVDSAKWKANVDFLFGGEDQLPHPTLEAITGVGNTPAYRGSLIAVFKNFDVSSAGDRIPSFQFVVTSKGDAGVSIGRTAGGWSYKYLSAPVGDTSSYSDENFDYSDWPLGAGSFASDDLSEPGWPHGTVIPDAATSGAELWVRRKIEARDGEDIAMEFIYDSWIRWWWNGELMQTLSQSSPATLSQYKNYTIPGSKVRGVNQLVFQFNDSFSDLADQRLLGIALTQDAEAYGDIPLSQIVSNICLRGGLSASDIDVDDMASTNVAGYPIARQATAADCILPLTQAYFAYASEYDAQLHFKFYGADATITVSRDDLIENTDSDDGNIVSNLRNQETEFPRRIVGTYMDPAQNYQPVTVAAERRSIDVNAIGDQAFSIPVVMSLDDATQAVNKSLKVTYATLQGTIEYSTTFADSAVYLSLACGEPLIFQGKRYVVDEMMLSNGSLKFTTRYDRQSAYTSNVQAIAGNAPSGSASRYSGPTTLIPMNLPSLRPQDTYGVYLAAASTTGSASWRGCTVQVSYDGKASWVNGPTMTEASIFGALTADEPSGGEPLTVQVNGDLESVTDDQIAAQANAFAMIHSASTEIGQFKIATESGSPVEYDLTDVTRGQLGTTDVAAVTGDQLVMLDSAYFLPIDLSFKGKTIYFRAVGFNEVAEDADIVSIVYDPDTTVIYDAGIYTP